MDHMKRKLSFNQLSEENTKKLRSKIIRLVTYKRFFLFSFIII